MKYSLSILAVLLTNLSICQSTSNWCGTDENINRLIEKSPSLASSYSDAITKINSSINTTSSNVKSPTAVAVVPVVVHVIYDSQQGNISDAQVKDGIRVLNRDFRRWNPDSANTREVFQPYAAAAGFEFRLAEIDPNGQPTDGIVRINSPMALNADDGVKALSYWNSSKYFNIWIVETIAGGSGGIILGYAQFPGFGPWNTYGYVVRNDSYGTIGTSNSDGRTATHEVGHCFGLWHTFQSGCGNNCSTSGDQVCDTPPTANSTQGCDNQQNLCGSNTGSPYSGDVVDQIENYMSYDDCQNMFSQGQVDRMLSTLFTHSQLQNLISSTNLTNTGVDDLAKVDFEADYQVVCQGTNITFWDESQYGQNQWTWDFPGGTPSSSSLQNPTITYNTPGIYNVSLNAGNGTASMQESKTQYILVVNPETGTLPFEEGFESSPFPNGDIIPVNLDGDSYVWEHTNSTSYSGSSCAKMNNFGNTAGNMDEFLTKGYDLSTLTSATINFKLAYAQLDTNSNDILRVYSSINCGETWYIRWSSFGDLMATVAPQTSAFIPSDTTEWAEYSINLASSFLKDNFILKFAFESDAGNNLYIDDINITGTYDTIPVLDSPLDGATNIAPNTLLNWKTVNGIDYYECQLASNPSFSNIVINGAKNATSAISNEPDTEFEVQNLVDQQQYWWRVRAIKSGVPYPWSDIWEFTVGTSVGIVNPTNNFNDFVVYPNPNGGHFELYWQNTDNASVKLYDMMGRLVQVIKAGSVFTSIDISTEPNGVYFIKATSNRKTWAKKIIKN